MNREQQIDALVKMVENAEITIREALEDIANFDETGAPTQGYTTETYNYVVEGCTSFKEEIFRIMLPIVYKRVEQNNSIVSTHSRLAVEAAAEIAELAERRLYDD